MKTSYFVLLLLLVLVYSCSPKVSVSVLKSYPPLHSGEEVKVYESERQVPKQAESLAKVTVQDAGMSVRCNYDQVLTLAKNEAAKIGGNGLLITDHTTPSFWGSSCHQIGGTILRTSGTASRGDTLSPAQVAYASLQENAKRDTQRPPTHTFSANIGYAYVLNRTKGLTGVEKQAEDNLSSGLTWDVQYQCFPKSIYGFGAIYSGYSSSATYNGLTENVLLTYIAPMFCMKGHIAKDWLAKIGCGIGYIGYASTYPGTPCKVTASNVGSHLNLGLEYMINRNFGIGADFSMTSGSFGSVKVTNAYSTQTVDLGDVRLGVSHLKFVLGMRYYLP